jgi:hypothetical protein
MPPSGSHPRQRRRRMTMAKATTTNSIENVPSSQADGRTDRKHDTRPRDQQEQAGEHVVVPARGFDPPHASPSCESRAYNADAQTRRHVSVHVPTAARRSDARFMLSCAAVVVPAQGVRPRATALRSALCEADRECSLHGSGAPEELPSRANGAAFCPAPDPAQAASEQHAISSLTDRLDRSCPMVDRAKCEAA